jgi:hypothetical protein
MGFGPNHSFEYSHTLILQPGPPGDTHAPTDPDAGFD